MIWSYINKQGESKMEKITQKFIREVLRARKSGGGMPASIFTDSRLGAVSNALCELGRPSKHGANLKEIQALAIRIAAMMENI